jgi:hypothetical protein
LTSLDLDALGIALLVRLETTKGTRKLSFGQPADEASIASVLADTARMLEIPVKDARRPTGGPYRG